MHIVFLTIVFLILISLASFLINIGVQNWLVFTIMVILYIIILIVPSLWFTYKSNNLRAIGIFLKSNRKKPLYSYPYLTAHGNQVELEEGLERIMKRYNQASLHHTYGAILAIHRKNNAALKEHAQQIGTEPLQSYYLAYYAALKHRFEEVEDWKKNINEVWMHHALNAVVADIQEDTDAFARESEEAVRLARGVQKYSLYYSFKKMGKK